MGWWYGLRRLLRFANPKSGQSFTPADVSSGRGRKSEALGEALEIQLPKPLAAKEPAECVCSAKEEEGSSI